MTTWLSVAQAAELAGVKVGTIRPWIRQRRFPIGRAGRFIRIDRAVFEAWLRRETQRR